MYNYLILIIALALVLLLIYVVALAIKLGNKSEKEEVRNILSDLSFEDKEEETIKKFPIEEYVINKFKVPVEKQKIVILAIRIIFVVALAVTFNILGALGLSIFAAFYIASHMDLQYKNVVEASGILNIGKIVSFMDYFEPQISSGSSADTAFVNYIYSLDDDDDFKPLLEEYYNARANDDYSYQTPPTIQEITTIYEDAVYNEDMGFTEYYKIIREAKEDYFQKNRYFTEFNSRMGEVIRPVVLSYYVGVPIIIFILMSSFGDFWFTMPGFVVSVLILILFFCFKKIINTLQEKTLKEFL